MFSYIFISNFCFLFSEDASFLRGRMRRGATATLLLACSAVAFQISHPNVQGLTRASKLRGLCQTRMRAAGAEPIHSRRSAIAFLIVGLVGVPGSSFAAKKSASPDAGETFETISLDDFYAALEDQEVLKVEFDGPKFEVRPSSHPLSQPKHTCLVRYLDATSSSQRNFP
jgi:hypothetical protein